MCPTEMMIEEEGRDELIIKPSLEGSDCSGEEDVSKKSGDFDSSQDEQSKREEDSKSQDRGIMSNLKSLYFEEFSESEFLLQEENVRVLLNFHRNDEITTIKRI